MLKEILLIIAVILIIWFWYANSTPKIYFLYSPNCGYCQKFKPIWDSRLGGYQCTEIDITNPGPYIGILTREHRNGMQGVPHVVKYVGFQRYVFSGPRTLDNLNNFIIS